MTYTEYVKLDEEINSIIEDKDNLTNEISRLQAEQRVARHDFPDTFYVRVGDMLIYRSDGGRNVRVVHTDIE